ncbi:hypothetical protein ACET3X_009019 [Alternaria dauci]|uniref:F-box domain-containing protein n=1 Tax=Alternaria dauci TaxID=48095 RepID=A0ABR3U8U6_9PLEO
MEQPSTSMSRREDHSRFLELPAELRNRIYEFAAKTQDDLPRRVLPCLALAQTCRKLRTEYRPICIKQDVIIDWQKVEGYMRTFFPTVNGRIQNIELVPMSMTIVAPWRVEGDSSLHLDVRPMIKIGLYQPGFTCTLIKDPEGLVKEKEVSAHGSEDFLDEGTVSLNIVMRFHNEEWMTNIETGRITKMMLSNIGVHVAQQDLSYINIHCLSWGDESDDTEEIEMVTEHIYFKRVEIFKIWSGESGDSF